MITAFYEMMFLSLFLLDVSRLELFFLVPPLTTIYASLHLSHVLTGAQCIDIGVPTLDGIWRLLSLLPLLLLSMWLSLYDLPLSL